eukprot:2944983-Lingulodinium_polyedra.AAC.1
MEDLNHEQRRFTQALMDAIGLALSVQRAPSPAVAQALIDDGGHETQVCFGIPGVGKTTCVDSAFEHALKHDGHILLANYTA